MKPKFITIAMWTTIMCFIIPSCSWIKKNENNIMPAMQMFGCQMAKDYPNYTKTVVSSLEKAVELKDIELQNILETLIKDAIQNSNVNPELKNAVAAVLEGYSIKIIDGKISLPNEMESIKKGMQAFIKGATNCM